MSHLGGLTQVTQRRSTGKPSEEDNDEELLSLLTQSTAKPSQKKVVFNLETSDSNPNKETTEDGASSKLYIPRRERRAAGSGGNNIVDRVNISDESKVSEQPNSQLSAIQR